MWIKIVKETRDQAETLQTQEWYTKEQFTPVVKVLHDLEKYIKNVDITEDGVYILLHGLTQYFFVPKGDWEGNPSQTEAAILHRLLHDGLAHIIQLHEQEQDEF